MFHKALLYQNYKQTKIIVWIMLVLYILALPIQAIFSIESWEYRLHEASIEPHYYHFDLHEYDFLAIFSNNITIKLVAIAIVVFACLLIGAERNTRRMDFTFSLPFSRRDLFLTKWLYGLLLIILFHSLSFGLAYMIIKQSQFAYGLSMVTMKEIFIAPLIGFVLLFTFALFIGTFTGEMMSQFVLTWIFAFFVFVFIFLVMAAMDIHFLTSFRSPEWIKYLNPGWYIFDYSDKYFELFGIIGTIIFAISGLILYEKNKVEHNGEFLIFKQLHLPFLIIFTVYFSLIGGLIVSAIVWWDASLLRISAYWIGFLIFFLFSFIIIQRLLHMNVIVKNK